jgi:hypothetical protein
VIGNIIIAYELVEINLSINVVTDAIAKRGTKDVTRMFSADAVKDMLEEPKWEKGAKFEIRKEWKIAWVQLAN